MASQVDVQRLPVREVQNLVWNAVTDKLDLDPRFDHDGAVLLADRAKMLIDLGDRWQREYRRRDRVGTLKEWLGWAAALSAAALGLFFLIDWAVNHGRYDYAGYGPSKVPAHAADAIQTWYGENDPPTNLIFKGQTHSQVYGRPAWEVFYRTDSGKRICVWVWNNGQSNGANQFKVGRGAECRA